MFGWTHEPKRFSFKEEVLPFRTENLEHDVDDELGYPFEGAVPPDNDDMDDDPFHYLDMQNGPDATGVGTQDDDEVVSGLSSQLTVPSSALT